MQSAEKETFQIYISHTEEKKRLKKLLLIAHFHTSSSYSLIKEVLYIYTWFLVFYSVYCRFFLRGSKHSPSLGTHSCRGFKPNSGTHGYTKKRISYL